MVLKSIVLEVLQAVGIPGGPLLACDLSQARESFEVLQGLAFSVEGQGCGPNPVTAAPTGYGDGGALWGAYLGMSVSCVCPVLVGTLQDHGDGGPATTLLHYTAPQVRVLTTGVHPTGAELPFFEALPLAQCRGAAQLADRAGLLIGELLVV